MRRLQLGDDWISHFLDARTGEASRSSLSVTVVAPDATSANAVATIAGALVPVEGLRICQLS